MVVRYRSDALVFLFKMILILTYFIPKIYQGKRQTEAQSLLFELNLSVLLKLLIMVSGRWHTDRGRIHGWWHTNHFNQR